MTKVLTIPVKGVYFTEIVAGTKTEEFRLITPSWTKKLSGRHYALVEMTFGYPKRADRARRSLRVWKGFRVKTITHPHFGPDPVQVFAIDVSEVLALSSRELEALQAYGKSDGQNWIIWGMVKSSQRLAELGLAEQYLPPSVAERPRMKARPYRITDAGRYVLASMEA